MKQNDFYTSLATIDDFGALAQPGVYARLPDDWVIGTADIVASRDAIAKGHYKAVNMIAASVITAQLNAHDHAAFPYAFGGDGASFAIPSEWADRAETVLAETRAWAMAEFGLDLRVATVSVAEIRANGKDVSVARYRITNHLDYAMFSGGGVRWAEAAMKDGQHGISPAPENARPDLSGLGCRWNELVSQNGVILSLLVVPAEDGPHEDYVRAVQEVLFVLEGVNRSGHPSPSAGPDVSWPPPGVSLETKARNSGRSFVMTWFATMAESLVAWILIKTGMTLGAFNARAYKTTVGHNMDFRKFDDGLKMTLDCDPETEKRLMTLLEQQSSQGIIRYGVHRQQTALITCIVPSPTEEGHMHFVDGAGGGFTAAAAALDHKTRMTSLSTANM